jgi:hypothetical protein
MGRDELGRLEELRHALYADDDLKREGITLFGAGVDPERETIRLQVAAADSERAREEIRRRYGDRIDVEVVAASAYVVKDLPWECWIDGPGTRVTIWARDYTEGAELRASHQESHDEVVITLSGPRWQGAHEDVGYVVRKEVQLSQPVGRRHVIDGATGAERPRRAMAI